MSLEDSLQHGARLRLRCFLTFTIKDVYRFGVGLELGCDSDDPSEKVLQIIDFRYLT